MDSVGDSTDAKRLAAARRLLEIFAETLDLDLRIRLWDGSRVSLGKNVRSSFEIVVENAGVLRSLIRRPTPANLMLHYADGSLRLEGGDPLDFIWAAESNRGIRRLSQLPRWRTLRAAIGVAKGRPEHAGSLDGSSRRSEKVGKAGAERIEFHYDIGNEFYALFLGREMQYSCGYFEKPDFDLDRAQEAKLDRLCQRLQLQRGERLLDVGCGWGGLLCHAAERYGVRAHGLTLSPAQFEYAERKIRERGLEAQVTVELADIIDFTAVTDASNKTNVADATTASVSSTGVSEKLSADPGYDKIASIEMIEHIGLANYPAYFKKLRSLLREEGFMVVQATMRRAKRTTRRSKKLRIGSRLIERYVFPGFELDNLGHTTAAMEATRFEILETSGWRQHYAKTTTSWCRRLWERQKEAEAIVGAEKTRLWLAYLAGVSAAFDAGSLRVYQILASQQGRARPADRKPSR